MHHKLPDKGCFVVATVASLWAMTGPAKLRADTFAVSWGANAYGQLGNNTTAASTAPVFVTGSAGATAVAGGDAHSLAIINGGVAAWGLGNTGQVGNGNAATLPSIFCRLRAMRSRRSIRRLMEIMWWRLSRQCRNQRP